MSIRHDGTRSARVIQVVETVALRGNGTEEDPTREVKQYWDFEGKLLAEYDPCANKGEVPVRETGPSASDLLAAHARKLRDAELKRMPPIRG